jgi:hypothetical protein
VFLGQQSIAEHIARAGSQQVLGQHLLGNPPCVLPNTGLEPRV